MNLKNGAALATMVTAALLGGLHVAAAAHERDPDMTSKAEERLDKANRDIADRAAKRDADYAEDRARIEADAIKDPRKAEDLEKLDADYAEETRKLTEDADEAKEEFIEESSDEADDLAEMDEDRASRGSSRQMRDLGRDENAEYDDRGFPVRRGEVVGIDLAPATVAKAEAKGFKVLERDRLVTLDREVIRLAAPPGMDARAALAELRAIDPAAVIDLVHYYGLNLAAGGKGRRVGASEVRRVAPTKVTVGIIDTAIAPHAALRGAQVFAWPAGNLAGAPVDHGTAVASLISAEGQARIFSANIFRGSAARPYTSADVLADALEWMVKMDVPTINMSLAGPRNAILDQLLRDAVARGRSIVAAAGNGGPAAPPAYPAAVPGVVAVTAVDKDLRIYRYANRGRYITVAARGVDVIAARASGGFARFSGTSFATPHVTGWIARCRSAGNPARSCEAALRKSARDLGTPGRDDIFGLGYVE